MSQSNGGRRYMIAGALLVAGALAAVVQPARAQASQTQTSQLDSRWQGWLGCWAPVGVPAQGSSDSSMAQLVCVSPATGTTGVDVSTIANGKVVTHERLVATGKHIPTAGNGCAGWQSSQWSAEGRRVYLRSEDDCSGGTGGLMRTTNGVLAITPMGEWLDVRGVTVGEGTGVQILRYRSVPIPSSLPSEVADALQGRTLSVRVARTAAGVPLTVTDVMEASGHLNAKVLQAWLVAQHQSFDIDAQKLVTLADAGVPGPVIDAMVALSYPDAFEINPGSAAGQVAQANGQRNRSGERAGRHVVVADPYGYSQYGYYSPFGYSPFGYSPFGYSPFGYSPFGYSSFGYPSFGFGYGGFGYGGSPVIIIRNPDNADQPPAPSHGTMVKGRGYVPASGGSSSGRHAAPASRIHHSTSGSRGSVRSTGSSVRSSGHTTAHPVTTRKAKPRTGNGNG